MAPTKLVNVHVKWSELAPLLDSVAEMSLPMQTTCPLCHKGQLTIYQDSISGEEWHYCFSCESSGDLIHLASKVWDCDLIEAITRMADAGLTIPYESLSSENLTKYVEQITAYRTRVANLWSKAQRNMTETRCGKSLLSRVGLLPRLDIERWESGPVKLYGTCNLKQFEQCFFPNSAISDNGSNARRSIAWPFKGGGWKDLILIPYFQGPTRLSGMLFIGRLGRKYEDFIYKRILLDGTKDDPGLAGLMGITQQHKHVIAMDDALLMSRVQARHFSSDLYPLPIVAWRPKTNCWSVLNGKRIIFWSVKPTAELIAKLLHVEAELAIFGPSNQTRNGISHWLRLKCGADIENRVLREALPWRVAITKWIKRTSQAKVQHLMHEAGKRNDGVLEALQACTDELNINQFKVRRVTIHNRTYTERNGVLYQTRVNKEIRVFPGTIRISKVINYTDFARYTGHMLRMGKEIPFTWSGNASVGFALRLEYMLRKNNIHTPLPSQYMVRKDLLAAAIALSNPQVLEGQASIGWVADSERFWFQNYSISAGKNIHMHDSKIFPGENPGPTTPPKQTNNYLDHLATTGDAAEYFWALTISVLSAIIAPSVGEISLVTLLVGNESRGAAEIILARLGVPERVVWYRRTGTRLLAPFKWEHNYPVSIKMENLVTLGKIHDWLLNLAPPQTIHAADNLNAHLLACQGGFNLIHCEEVFAVRRISQIPMETVIPWFLRDMKPTSSDWLEIQKTLLKWLKQLGCKGSAVQNCSRFLVKPTDNLLERTIAQLFKKGTLTPQETKSSSRRGMCDWNETGLLVTHDNLRKACRSLSFSVPPLDAVNDPIVVPRKYF